MDLEELAKLGNVLGAIEAPGSWEELPRLSTSSRTPSSSSSLSSLSSSPEADVGIGVAVGGARRSFSYYRLPEPDISLTVLKLNGSIFDVKVVNSATVSELKIAVEEVFEHPPEGEEKVVISWCHVWGHFCLTYEGYKLVDDKASLRSYGIKDGDQLVFERHLSLNYNPAKRKPRFDVTIPSERRLRLTAPEGLEQIKENSEDDSFKSISSSHSKDAEDWYKHGDEEDDLIPQTQRRAHHRLRRGWFSYSRLSSSGSTKPHAKFRRSRFSTGCLPIGY